MDNSQRAWELAMVLIASGKISFDPANPVGSVKILAEHLQAMEAALQEQRYSTQILTRARNV